MDYSRIEEKILEIKALMEPHQIGATAFAVKNRRGLIEAPVGAGKTLIGSAAGLYLRPRKLLIICSRNALNTWRYELQKWFPEVVSPDEVAIVDDEPGVRWLQWYNRLKGYEGKYHVWITTFGKMLNDLDHVLKLDPDVVIVDEVHRARNRKSKVFDALKQITKPKKAFSTDPSRPALIMLTGTPGDKGVEHMWGYFHLADPKFFTSYWRFVGTFCEVVDGMFGKEIIGPKNTSGFEQMSRPYLHKINVEDTKLEKVLFQWSCRLSSVKFMTSWKRR
jgi:SNF2 family DNA or RNA helicase